MPHRKRRGGVSRSSRQNKNSIKTAVVLQEVDPLASVISVLLATKADFAPFSQATMMTIRGWLAIQPTTGSTADDSVAFAIWKADEDLGLTNAQFNPWTAANYTDEDCIWTAGAVCTHVSTATLIGGGGVPHIDVNIQTKRIIKEGEDLRLSFANLFGTGEQVVSGVLRTFLQVRS